MLLVFLLPFYCGAFRRSKKPNCHMFKKLTDNLKHQVHSRLSINEVAKFMITKLRTEKSFNWSNANFLKLLISPLYVAYFGCLLPSVDCQLIKKLMVNLNLSLLLNVPIVCYLLIVN